MEQTIELWPIKDLFEHPDNPRRVRADSAAFADLLASVKANGVIEPLTVRSVPGRDLLPNQRQVLSGHRRLLAARQAGLSTVPVIDKGELADDLAFDIVAMGNLHEALTPIEEGRRVASWLDKYGQDVAAVAAKLGKPAHWVVQHAEIARGLSAEWVAVAEGRTACKCWGVEDGDPFGRWTAGQWAVIARLPAGKQASELKKFLSGSYCSFDRWSVKELQSRVKLDQLLLNRAEFEVSTCEGCVKRTDRAPLLWGETVEEAVGDKARCLDKKCWERKTAAYAKRELTAIALDKGVPGAVPVSLLECPENDYRRQGRYADRIRDLKKKYGARLLTADKVEVVAEGAKGAVAGIAVAGARGKAAMGVVWVRPKKEPACGRGRSGNFETPRMKKERIENERWGRVVKAAGERFYGIKPDGIAEPKTAAILVLGRLLDYEDREVGDLLKAWRQGEAAVLSLLADLVWRDLVGKFRALRDWGSSWKKDTVIAAGTILGVDVQGMYDAVVAEEEKACPAEPKGQKKGKTKAKQSKGGKSCSNDPTTCKIGCDPCLGGEPADSSDPSDEDGDGE